MGERTDEGLLVTKKFDDAKWHYGGDFPSDLPIEAGYTPIGMFVAWAISAGLVAAEEDITDLDDLRRTVLGRSVTPGKLFERQYDGKFLDDCLTEEGKTFATDYYENSNGYFEDYNNLLIADFPSLYHVEDSWNTFDKLKPFLDRRLDEWKRGTLQLKQPT
jgi:hypothetical protein